MDMKSTKGNRTKHRENPTETELRGNQLSSSLPEIKRSVLTLTNSVKTNHHQPPTRELSFTARTFHKGKRCDDDTTENNAHRTLNADVAPGAHCVLPSNSFTIKLSHKEIKAFVYVSEKKSLKKKGIFAFRPFSIRFYQKQLNPSLTS